MGPGVQAGSPGQRNAAPVCMCPHVTGCMIHSLRHSVCHASAASTALQATSASSNQNLNPNTIQTATCAAGSAAHCTHTSALQACSRRHTNAHKAQQSKARQSTSRHRKAQLSKASLQGKAQRKAGLQSKARQPKICSKADTARGDLGAHTGACRGRIARLREQPGQIKQTQDEAASKATTFGAAVRAPAGSGVK